MRLLRSAPWMRVAALGAGLLLEAGQAQAYCRTTTCEGSSVNAPECEIDLDGCASRGVPLFWPSRCIAMAVHESGSTVLNLTAGQAETLLAEAASEWTRADCFGTAPSLQFMTVGSVACETVEFNPEGPNANVVHFRDSEWEHGFFTLGLTSLTFAVSSGEIRGADIELNSAGIVSSGFESQLRRIVTHEVGHVFGLAHSLEPGAIMNASYASDGVTSSSLAPDDLRAICAVYPPGVTLPACDPSRGFDERCGGRVEGSCVVGAPGGRSAARWLALMVAAAAVVGWRMRRRGSRS